ncbi:hypothetical protein HKX48_006897 [Thoreauomyces humboldtii]|nr:hypothetical protein HKX48_006897 [Thoreauomyces humboldtii]
MVLVREWPLRKVHTHTLPLSDLRKVSDPILPPPIFATSQQSHPLLYPRAALNRARIEALEDRVGKRLDASFPGLSDDQRSAVLGIVKENERIRNECKGIGGETSGDEKLEGDDADDEEEDEEGDVDTEFEILSHSLEEPTDRPGPVLTASQTATRASQKYAQFIDHRSNADSDPAATVTTVPSSAVGIGSGNGTTGGGGGGGGGGLIDETTHPVTATITPTASSTTTTTATDPSQPPAPHLEMRRVILSLGAWVHATLDTPTLFLPDSVAPPPPQPGTDFDALLTATAAPSSLTPAVTLPDRHPIKLEETPPDVLAGLIPENRGLVGNGRRKGAVKALQGSAGRKRKEAECKARKLEAEGGKVHGNFEQGYGKWYVRPELWNAFMQKNEAERIRHTKQQNAPAHTHRQISTLIHVKLTEIAATRAREELALQAYAAAGQAAAAAGGTGTTASGSVAPTVPGTAGTLGEGVLMEGRDDDTSRRTSMSAGGTEVE